LSRAPPHLGDEAAVPFFAFLAEASVGAGVELVPKGACLWELGEFGAVAGPRGLLPRGNGAVMLNLLETAEHGLIGEIEQLLATQIVVASLHVTDAELAIALGKERALQRRNVFEEKLFLKVLGSG